MSVLRTKEIYRFSNYALDVTQRSLTRGRQLLELKGKGFDVLVHLVRNRGQMLSKEAIFDAVWREREASKQTAIVFDPNLVDQALTSIRRALGRETVDVLLRTERAHGVAFIAKVTLRRYGISHYAIVTVLGTVAAALVVFSIWTPHDSIPTIDGRPKPITSTGYPKFGPFVGDSHRLFFTEHENNRFRIGWVELGSGKTGSLQTGLESAAVAGISRDRSTLLIRGPITDYHADGPLSLISRDGGDAVSLNLVGFDGDWSPDGKSLAYSVGNEIYEANLSTGSRRLLLTQTEDGIPWWPRFAPDGRLLRYSVFGRRSQSSSTWELNLHTGKFKKQSDTSAEWESAACGEWDLSGKGFFFQVGNGNGPFTIWWKSERPGRPRVERLTSPGPFNYQFPTARIADGRLYVRGHHAKAEMAHFYPENPTRVETFQSSLSASLIVLSPDGSSSLSYRSNPSEELLLVDLRTGAQKVLIPFPLQSFIPTWSPDGKRIAVPVRAPGSIWKINLVTVADGTRDELKLLDTQCIDPVWARDGGSVVFGVIPSIERDASTVSLYSVDLNTRKVSKVPGSDGLYRPAWSPNGRYLAAIDAKSGKVQVLDKNRSQWLQANIAASYLVWTRDSEGLFFTRPGRDSLEMARLTVSSLKDQKIMSIPRFKHLVPWFGTMADGSFLIPRDLSTQEVYEIKLR